MKMKTKMAAIFAILIITLSIAGFAYAHWEKIIYINGTVTTGTFEVIPSFHVDALVQDKPVANLTSVVDEAKNTLNITLTNVYPCLWVTGYIDFNNTGTIPVHLVDVKTFGNDTLDLENMGVITNGTYQGYTDYEVYDGIKLIANLYLLPNFPNATATDPYQIDAKGVAYINFALHFKEDLPQGVNYWFSVHFIFWNWNESPHP